MIIRPTKIPDVLEIEPRVFGDHRGYFLESFNSRAFREQTGLKVEFVQDNHSYSTKGTLRGLHYQLPRAQGKLVRVVSGEVFDVAVDLRSRSPTLGQWVGARLSSTNHRQLWIPPGFAHGFLVVSAEADFLYKTTDYYAPECEHVIDWRDKYLAIDWPITGAPKIAAKDEAGTSFENAMKFQ